MKTNNYTNSCEMFNVKWQLIKFRACHDSRFGYEIAVVADAGFQKGGEGEKRREEEPTLNIWLNLLLHLMSSTCGCPFSPLMCVRCCF